MHAQIRLTKRVHGVGNLITVVGVRTSTGGRRLTRSRFSKSQSLPHFSQRISTVSLCVKCARQSSTVRTRPFCALGKSSERSLSRNTHTAIHLHVHCQLQSRYKQRKQKRIK